MPYRNHQNTLIFLPSSIPFEFINSENRRYLRNIEENGIQNAVYCSGGNIIHLCNGTERSVFMQGGSDKGCQPGRTMEVTRKKFIIFVKTFPTGTNIASFVQNQVTVFQLKRKILDSLHPVVMYFFGRFPAGRANLLFGVCFDAYSARTAHPFRRNGAPFRFKLSKAQQVDYLLLVILRSLPGNSRRYALDVIRLKQASA